MKRPAFRGTGIGDTGIGGTGTRNAGFWGRHSRWLSAMILAVGTLTTSVVWAQDSLNTAPILPPSPSSPEPGDVSPEPLITIENRTVNPNNTRPHGLIMTNPASFVIKGRKGGFWLNRHVSPLRRNLTLQFTDPPEAVTIHVPDFQDPNGDKIYPAEYVTCEKGAVKADLIEEEGQDLDARSCSPATFTVDESGLFTMHLHFWLYLEDTQEQTAAALNLLHANGQLFSVPPSGEFSGEILIIPTSQNQLNQAEAIIVPVLLRVQDGWMLPLLLLLFGVAMGMAVSAYSAGGRLSDEVTVGLNRLQSQIDRYRVDAQIFAIRTETYISDARAANEAQQLEEAQQAVHRAKEVWRKWYRQRTEWDAQFAYHSRLNQQVQHELEHYQSLYLQTISQKLDNMMRQAPEDFTNPGELRVSLQEVASKVREYGQMKTRWNHLKEVVHREFDHISEPDQKYVNTEIGEIKQVISSLSPGDTEGCEALKARLGDLIDKVKDLANTTMVPTFDATDGDEETESGQRKPLISTLTMIPPPTSVGQHHGVEHQQRERSSLDWLRGLTLWPDADGRLRTFYISSYIGSVVMLAALGFSSLYADNPTFGADTFGDYFSLVAWGFGAEATRDTVTKVVRKTDETSKD